MQLYKLLTLMLFFSLFITGCSNEKNEENNLLNTTQNTEGEEMNKTIVVMETSKGTIDVELDKNKAPITTENFLRYVNEGYYNGTIFHRVMPNFMIQGGGFTPDGKQKQTYSPIKLESQNGLKNTKGTIAMARTQIPDSATSQFFINTIDNEFLDYRPGNDGYAVFGKVVSGMDVVLAIEKVRTGKNGYHSDWPLENITINKVYVKN